MGGLALAAMGILRLRSVAFTAMPSAVGGAIAVIGVAVCGFAVFLLATGNPQLTNDQPVFSLAPTVPTPAPSELKNVTVTVRTASAPISGVPVTLQSRFAPDVTPRKFTATTDDSGRTTFAHIDVNPGSPWIAIAHYDGRDFPSDVIRAPRDITVHVAPVTFDPKVLTVDAGSIAIVGDADRLQVIQAMTVRNDSTKAFAGGLSLPLLDGATAIDPRSGLDRGFLTLDNNNQIVSSAPVLPGSHEITYTYIAPMGRTSSPFSLRAFYATRRADVLTGGKVGLQPRGTLHDNGTVKLGGRTYHRYTANHLHAGKRLVGRVVIKQPSRVPTRALLVVAILLALVIIAFPLLRRRRDTPSPGTPAPKEVQPEWT